MVSCCNYKINTGLVTYTTLNFGTNIISKDAKKTTTTILVACINTKVLGLTQSLDQE